MEEGRVILEAVLRSIAVGLYLACVLLLVRPHPSPVRGLGALAYLSKACHCVAQFPPLMLLAGPLGPLLTLASMMGAALTWTFGVELLQPGARFDRRRLVAPLLVLLIGGVATFLKGPAALSLWLLHTFLSVALMSHLLIVIVRALRDPDMERARLLPVPLFLISAVYSIGVGYVQTLEAFGQQARQPSLFAAALLLTTSALAVLVFGHGGPAIFGERTDAPTVRAAEPQRAGLSAAEASLAGDLERLMREERLYRLQNLRISSLALRLRIPEHRLRQLLNQSLGYRNFNAYIARWRLAEAREALADPSQAEVPISTIAIDSGFQSLAPFNRAFKAQTGMTPSEYRARALEAGAPEVHEEAAA